VRMIARESSPAPMIAARKALRTRTQRSVGAPGCPGPPSAPAAARTPA
jgi:hypothetical protein